MNVTQGLRQVLQDRPAGSRPSTATDVAPGATSSNASPESRPGCRVFGSGAATGSRS